jgi:flagellar basal body-associated protein FliL
MAKQADRTEDRHSRGYSRELLIMVVIAALVIAGGAIYTLVNGPQPSPGAMNKRSPAATPTPEPNAVLPPNVSPDR